MQILIAPLEDLILAEKTYLSADEASGQTVLSVSNPQGFAANDYVVIGNIGNEQAELRQISSTSTNTITISSSISFAHDNGEPIQKMLYNQIKFYRSSDNVTYTHLSGEGSPVTIEVDDPEGTRLEDSTGSSSYYYKSTYYNSTTADETSLSNSTAEQGNDTSHYTSIYKIKKEAGFARNSYISSEDVSRYRTWAENKAESAVAAVYQLPFASTPQIFQEIVTLLSAGMLLSEEYGTEADVEISKTGQRKIEMAEKMLTDISEGRLLLLNSDKSELARLTSNKASSSNIYSSNLRDKGELFNLNDENFKMTDPTDPTASSQI